jgi:hypothetical protein
MDAVVEKMATEYDKVAKAGQEQIRSRWHCLQASTRKALHDTGWYSERGERLQLEEQPYSGEPKDDVDRLEYAVGRFKLCAGAKLPARKDKGAEIPAEALTDEVLSSCEDVLGVPAWHDPDFLRLALVAIAAHQEANMLTMIGPKNTDSPASPALGVLGSLVKVALVYASPWAAGAGIAAATRQDIGTAALSFYVVAGGIWAAVTAKVQPHGGTVFERSYNAWQQFRYSRAFGVMGAAARRELDRMATEGLRVPHIAFDVCEALRCRIGARGG